MKKGYVFQVKIKGIDKPQTLISGKPKFDTNSIQGEVEWFRLIGVITNGEWKI